MPIVGSALPPMSDAHDTQPAERERINTAAWWDDYFRSSWERYDGSLQTQHFMRQLLLNLPPREAAFLRRGDVSVLDWGCAFGEGVAVLAEAFPDAHVEGADFSGEAIDVARERFPGRAFHRVGERELPGTYDVILTSNCLEHLEQPLDMVRFHLRS